MGMEVIPHQPVSLWRNRDYLLFWLGHAVSSFGTSFTQFAFPLLIVGTKAFDRCCRAGV